MTVDHEQGEEWFVVIDPDLDAADREHTAETDALRVAVHALAVHLRLTAVTSEHDVFGGDFDERIASARAILAILEPLTPIITDVCGVLDLNAPGNLYEAPRRVRHLIDRMNKDAQAVARRYHQ